jgi:20S proteasome alpha/beta subunit
MTSIVGIKCKDGIVIGADSSATFSVNGQFNIMEQPIEKIEVIRDKVIVAGTGEIGLGQRFCALVQRQWDGKHFKNDIETCKDLTKLAIDDFSSTHAKMGSYGALVAFPAEKKPVLCEFAVSNFQPEIKTEKIWYVSMGSGQPITDPFLAFIREIFWKDGLPSVNQATFAVTWILDHAIRINAGGVNGPIRIAVLETKGEHLEARSLSDTDLDEAKQNVDDIKKYLGEYQLKGKPTESLVVPKA